MRTVSAFLIAFSFCGAGYLFSKKLDLRVKKLEKIILMISEIKTEIEFSAQNINDIIDSLITKGDFGLLPFLNNLKEILSDGENFDFAWKKSLTVKENIGGLKKEDVELLLSFGSSLGKTDSSGQMNNCEMHIRFFEEKLKNAVNEKKMLSRPAKGIGFACSLTVLILFM